jgi:hypothetical protein
LRVSFFFYFYFFFFFMLKIKATFFEGDREISCCFVSGKRLVRQSKCVRVTRQILHNTQHGNMRHYYVTVAAANYFVEWRNEEVWASALEVTFILATLPPVTILTRWQAISMQNGAIKINFVTTWFSVPVLDLYLGHTLFSVPVRDLYLGRSLFSVPVLDLYLGRTLYKCKLIRTNYAFKMMWLHLFLPWLHSCPIPVTEHTEGRFI